MKIETTDNRNEIQAQIDILKLLYRKEVRILGAERGYAEGYNQGIFDMSMDIARTIQNLQKRLDQLELKNFKFYRLRHKPTGLFYRPSRTINVKLMNGDVVATKSNLSDRGKVYTRKPTGVLSQMRQFYNHTLLETKPMQRPTSQSSYSRTALERASTEYCKETDWEIVGYE